MTPIEKEAEENILINKILRFNEPYNLKDILEALVECSDILLHKKDYDGHGWERLEYCYRFGKEIIEVLENNNPNDLIARSKSNTVQQMLLRAIKLARKCAVKHDGVYFRGTEEEVLEKVKKEFYGDNS